jgi:hypothetical protein
LLRLAVTVVAVVVAHVRHHEYADGVQKKNISLVTTHTQ